MNRPLLYVPPVLLLIALVLPVPPGTSLWNSLLKQGLHEARAVKEEERPTDWFFAQRAYPFGSIDHAAYLAALREQQTGAALMKPAGTGTWELAGPVNIGGRITALAVPGRNMNTIYAGTAYGGVLRTRDGGQSWAPLSDNVMSLPIGDLAIDPRDTNVIYVGTGEANGSKISYGGDGVYGSTDGGDTWKLLGLQNSHSIGRVVVDPANSDRLFVAAMGEQAQPGPYRGLFRSTDRGATWTTALSLGSDVGCIEVVIDSTRPNIMYAAMWQRSSVPGIRIYGGPKSGLYRSTDAGATWNKLGGGLPQGSVGRIGMAYAPSRPDRLYATFTDTIGSFMNLYRSDDGGTTWDGVAAAQVIGMILNNDYGWWFGQLRVDPANPNRLYMLGVSFARSDDAGENWAFTDVDLHADHHALLIDPQNPRTLISGNDGGVYISRDRGGTWWKSPVMALTQVYNCEVDPSDPDRVYCGTQDNYTVRTTTGSLDDWAPILGGDGFHVAVDPTNSHRIYAEWQYGSINRSEDDGVTMINIRPALNTNDRFNWNTPFVLDPVNPARIYIGTQRLYVSTNRGDTWFPTSGDLSRGGIGFTYGTITSIAVAPSDTRVVYVGTDDGNVWCSQDAGFSWLPINNGLPVRWVTRLAVDPTDARTAYITFSGFGNGIYQPHLLRTTDYGTTWTDISGNLPEVPANDVVIDPGNRHRLYVATDLGVYTTALPNTGKWEMVATGMPNVAVMDLVLHKSTRVLYAGTFGRSIYRYNLNELQDVEPGDVAAETGTALRVAGPNPFTSGTRLEWQVAVGAHAAIELYDLTGRSIRTLALPEGQRTGSTAWDGRDDAGNPVPSGAYIARLRGGEDAAGVLLRVVR